MVSDLRVLHAVKKHEYRDKKIYIPLIKEIMFKNRVTQKQIEEIRKLVPDYERRIIEHEETLNDFTHKINAQEIKNRFTRHRDSDPLFMELEYLPKRDKKILFDMFIIKKKERKSAEYIANNWQQYGFKKPQTANKIEARVYDLIDYLSYSLLSDEDVLDYAD